MLTFGKPLTKISAIMIVAHPDDEVISAGGTFVHFEKVLFVHVTDGSPRNLTDALNCGFRTREAYALARKAELDRALQKSGATYDRISLDFVDQESIFFMSELIGRLMNTLIAEQNKYDIILTHPYEGGHPDHDATALAVHTAHNLLNSGLPIFEFSSYHLNKGSLSTFRFLPNGHKGEIRLLSEEEIQMKKTVVDCFVSQKQMLKMFPLDIEIFRPTPAYNFCCPPHDGVLYYELFNIGCDSETWRRLARKSCSTWRIPCTI